MNTFKIYESQLLKASDSLFEAGMNWYLHAHDEALKISHEYGISLAQSSGIISKLSPGIKWDRNIIAARLVLEGHSKVDGYGRNVQSARKIAMGRYGTSFLTVLDSFDESGAKKTRNFYQNIYNPTDSYPVTIDRWMFRAVGLSNSVREYDELAKVVRQVAHKHYILPNQAQAIIWLQTKEDSK